MRETLVKFEISFVDIGNYDDVGFPGILPGWSACRGALESQYSKAGAKGTTGPISLPASSRTFAEMRRIEREAREIGVGISIAAKAVGPLLDRTGVKLILTVASDLG